MSLSYEYCATLLECFYADIKQSHFVICIIGGMSFLISYVTKHKPAHVTRITLWLIEEPLVRLRVEGVEADIRRRRIAELLMRAARP